MKVAEILIQVVLGMVFIVSGLLKLYDPITFHGDILNFDIISGKMALGAAYIVPWLELISGTALIFRLRYPGAIVIYFGLVVGFSVFLLSALIRGIDISCGCFGGEDPSHIPLALARNVLLLCGIVFLGWRERSRLGGAGTEDHYVSPVQTGPNLNGLSRMSNRYILIMMAVIMGVGLMVMVSNAGLPLIRNSFIYGAITDIIIEHGFKPTSIISDEVLSFKKPIAFSFLSVPLALIFGINAGLKVASFLSAFFFLCVSYIFFKRINRKIGIGVQFIPLELGLLFFNPLVIYQFWSAYPDILFAGEVLLAFILTDKIVNEHNKKHVMTIILLGLVIYVSILTKLYGLVLGIACPVYFILHRRSFFNTFAGNKSKIACLLGVFAVLGVLVVLAMLGLNPMLDYGAGNPQHAIVGYEEFMQGMKNPLVEFITPLNASILTIVLNFHFALFFLFQRGNKPWLPKPTICFVGVFIALLLPFGYDAMYNMRYFIPIFPFVVVAIVQGLRNLKNVALRWGILFVYISVAGILTFNYNVKVVYESLLPFNEKIEESVFGAERSDNFRMNKHLELAKQIKLINRVVGPGSDLYWLSSYYSTSTHRVVKHMGIRPDIKMHYLLSPMFLPDKTIYITEYRDTLSLWTEKLKRRFEVTLLGPDVYRLVPLVQITHPVKDNFFRPGQPVELNVTFAESVKSLLKGVEFLINGQVVASASGPPYAVTWHSSGPGRYVAEARALKNQGLSILSSPLTVFVGTKAIERSIIYYDDDGEERPGGSMKLDSSDLELTIDPNFSDDAQIIGTRFTDIQVPQSAHIKKAYIQFTVDEVSKQPTELTIHAELVSNASVILDSRHNLSARNRTLNSVHWSPGPWNVKGEKSINQRTPDLSALIREVMDQPGWQEGNALMFLISGTGNRVAKSMGGAEEQDEVPMLYIEYGTVDSTSNVLLILGSGFEDIEAVTVLDVCGWTEYKDSIPNVRVTVTGLHPEIRGRYGTVLRREISLDSINPGQYDLVAIPGGFWDRGYGEIRDPRVYEIIRAVHAQGGTIATMCNGNVAVAKTGLLRGKRATSYPYGNNFAPLREAGAIFEDSPVVIDNRIITCQGPGQAIDVAFLILDTIVGPEARAEVQKYMMINNVE